MSRPPTKFYGQAWLIVARGGWWDAPEIVAQMDDEISYTDARTRLWFMARTGYVERRVVERRAQYCVTKDSKVPHGLSAGSVIEALTGATS